MIDLTTSVDEDRGVKCVHLGGHLIHECHIDCPDDEIHAELAGGFRYLFAQQKKQKKMLNRLLASTLIAAVLFITDLAFLGWHLQLFFGGDGH